MKIESIGGQLMNENAWQKLYENYETTWLLDAVDKLDELRTYLADGGALEPPQIRTDLLKLHSLAMNVVNHSEASQLQEMMDLAFDLEDQTSDMLATLKKVHETIQKLIDLLPEEDGFDDENELEDDNDFDNDEEDDFFDSLT